MAPQTSLDPLSLWVSCERRSRLFCLILFFSSGIGATVKNILTSSDGTTVDNTGDRRSTNPDETKDSSKRSSRQLPPGTGPGTSGKPGALASEVAMQHDLERARAGHGISGYGTDAAAAAGGTLAGTHQGKASSPGTFLTHM